jgi:hypothetical protein
MKTVRQSGFVVAGTLLIAAMSALALVAGCHSTVSHAGIAVAAAAAAGPSVAAAAPAASPDIATVHPFDEMFYVAPSEEAAPQN